MNLPPSCPSRELFERSLESTCRALAGEPGLQIDFSDQGNLAVNFNCLCRSQTIRQTGMYAA